MNKSSNKKKEEIMASIIRSFPIYEVQQICFESHRYPRRRNRLQRVGLFQTKESAEEALHEYIKHEKKCCETWGGNYYADCLGYFIDEVPVYNHYSEIIEDKRPNRCYSNTADGELNDCAALDEFGWYRGRRVKDIRFKEGDIVEILGYDYSELAIVSAPPPSKEVYKQLAKRAKEQHPKQSFFMDESDDCYLVYTLGEGDTHEHVLCYNVFRPTRPVPAKIAAQLKAKLEEMKTCTSRCQTILV